MSIEFFTRTESGWIVKPNIEVFQFPGGEWHIRGDIDTDMRQYAVVRGGSADDIVQLLLWADMASNDQYSNIAAFVPYLPGARADRGHPFGAGVYASLIRVFPGQELYYIDPHSPVIVEQLSWANEIAFEYMVERAIGLNQYDAVIAPDKGAHDRAKRVGDMLGVPTYFASKTRDFATGKLSGFQPPKEFYEWGSEGATSRLATPGNYLVVDDICDGGGTFMGLAGALRIPRENLDLWVTHGVFSGQAEKLNEYYGNIYTTDSHPGAKNEKVGAHVISVLPEFFERAGR